MAKLFSKVAVPFGIPTVSYGDLTCSHQISVWEYGHSASIDPNPGSQKCPEAEFAAFGNVSFLSL